MTASGNIHEASAGPQGARFRTRGRGNFLLGLVVLGAMALRGRRAPSADHQGAAYDGPPTEGSLGQTKSLSDMNAPANSADATTRGQDAPTPTHIPARGWWDIAKRVYQRIQEHRVMLVAAGVSYYALLALFPALAALVSLFGLVADPASIQQQLSNLQGVVPEEALQIIGDQISRIQAQGGRTLSLYFFIGLAVSLWSANAGVKSVFDALNIVYEEPERRSFLQYNLHALLFTLGGILFIILAVSGIVILPAVFAFVGLESMSGRIISLLRWPLLLVALLLALALLYRYGPSREKPQWKWVTPGSIFTAVVWLAGSMLFSWYVSSFGTYNETYGSLGAVIAFMVWMWLSATIVLVGAEINAQSEFQTRADSTTGEPRSMGERGANVADNVANSL